MWGRQSSPCLKPPRAKCPEELKGLRFFGSRQLSQDFFRRFQCAHKTGELYMSGFGKKGAYAVGLNKR